VPYRGSRELVRVADLMSNLSRNQRRRPDAA